MTREDAKKAAEVMLAYADGKEVERLNDEYEWVECEDPSFHWTYVAGNYRIKSTPTYRPFANAEECWEEMKKHQPFGWVKTATGIYRSIVWVSTYRIRMDKQEAEWKFEELFDKKFTFADGTPFGIKL